MIRPVLALCALLAADWPAYRGSQQDGVSTESILAEWPEGRPAELWRIEVGGGYAGLAVASARVLTLEQHGKQEVLAAYDASTGRQLWRSAWPGEYKSFLGGKGPRSTPAVQGGRVFASGTLGEFRAVDEATGRLLWRRDFRGDRGEVVRWGNAWSPVAADGLVFVQPNARGMSAAALKQESGEVVWKALDDEQAYTTPMLVDLAGKKQLLAVTAVRAVGLEPRTGKLLWSYPWKTDHGVNAAQPVMLGTRRILLSAGYGHGAALIEVDCSETACAANLVWENKNLKSKFNSPVVWKDHFYGLDEGILTCIDASSGSRKWKGGRYGYGQLILAGGRLIVTTEAGEVVLVDASPEGLRELARFRALNGKTWNMPALAGGVLYLRNEKELAAFRVGP